VLLPTKPLRHGRIFAARRGRRIRATGNDKGGNGEREEDKRAAGHGKISTGFFSGVFLGGNNS
jgi:hypothetical protein